MSAIWWVLIAFYVGGLVGTLWFQGGPVTVPLAFLRAVVWPVYWATGRPRGQVRSPD